MGKLNIANALVTGANRGIGLEFVKQLAGLPKPPRHIFATYRNKNSLQALEDIRKQSKESKVILLNADATNRDDVLAVRSTVEDTVGDRGLTLLINNAGIARVQPFDKITEENLMAHFQTNTVAPVMMVKEMLPLLKMAADRSDVSGGLRASRAAVLNISSTSGCIARTIDEPNEFLVVFGYKISKAALNMAMRSISVSLKDQGILVLQMNPGWVRTDMGTQLGELDPPEAISDMLKTLAICNESHHGSFIDRHGNAIPF